MIIRSANKIEQMAKLENDNQMATAKCTMPMPKKKTHFAPMSVFIEDRLIGLIDVFFRN